ncbi:MAG: flagellar assembly protein FliW [Fimbriimonadaceae bacterium]
MNTLANTRFGEVRFGPSDVWTFPDGLIGFPECRHFLLIHHREDSPFHWLQSIERPELAFLVTDPNRFVEGFAPELDDRDAQELNLTETTPHVLLTTVSIPPGRPQDLSLNLNGPIVVNLETREGRQFVVEADAYTKERIRESQGAASAAA